VIGSRQRAPYGRKRNSGQAALPTNTSDGWRRLSGGPRTTGPFGIAPDDVGEHGYVVHVERLAKHAIELVMRGTPRGRQ
jgi:hypothetical protein